jgi:hypothetical protein
MECSPLVVLFLRRNHAHQAAESFGLQIKWSEEF